MQANNNKVVPIRLIYWELHQKQNFHSSDYSDLSMSVMTSTQYTLSLSTPKLHLHKSPRTEIKKKHLDV